MPIDKIALQRAEYLQPSGAKVSGGTSYEDESFHKSVALRGHDHVSVYRLGRFGLSG